MKMGDEGGGRMNIGTRFLSFSFDRWLFCLADGMKSIAEGKAFISCIRLRKRRVFALYKSSRDFSSTEMNTNHI